MNKHMHQHMMVWGMMLTETKAGAVRVNSASPNRQTFIHECRGLCLSNCWMLQMKTPRTARLFFSFFFGALSW